MLIDSELITAVESLSKLPGFVLRTGIKGKSVPFNRRSANVVYMPLLKENESIMVLGPPKHITIENTTNLLQICMFYKIIIECRRQTSTLLGQQSTAVYDDQYDRIS